ncbi:MAG: DUF3769 domain-containing protein [Limnothrix sp.]
MGTDMSAIATLCAISCTVASVSTATVNPVVVEQDLAQIPMNVDSQITDIESDNLGLEPGLIETETVELETEETFSDVTVEDSVAEPQPDLRQIPANVDAQIIDIESDDFELEEEQQPDLRQIPAGVDAQIIDVESDSLGQELEPIDVETVEMETDGVFTDVMVEDRQGEQQQFSLETETESPFKVLEIIGDRQEYDQPAQVVTATGNVTVRFDDSVLTADQVDVSLTSKLVIANGNVTLRRGQQILYGQRFDYFFVQNRGFIRQARGEVAQNAFQQDADQLAVNNPFSNITDPAILLNERLLLAQPATDIRGTEDGINFTIGSDRNLPGRNLSQQSNSISRVRFYAEEVEFIGDRWEAKDVRLTNDPFNPPELQVIASTATFNRIDEFTNELVTTDTRLVIDDNISLPIYPRTYRFSSSDDNSLFSAFSIGYDGDERGGLYIQRPITLFRNAKGRWTVTPQYLVQKAFFPETPLSEADDEADSFVSPSAFAFTTEFKYDFSPRSLVVARASLPSLNLEGVEDRLKVNLRVEQRLGQLNNPFRLSQEFNYRDRLFNGSLGFQRVKSSIGLVLRSPVYLFGNSGFSLNYQASLQNINADTDRLDLLSADAGGRGEVNLTRYQGAVNLNHGITLWSGKALPATREQGLRYSPRPIVPYVSLGTGIRGVASGYSSGDRQLSLNGTIGIQGQVGHFARKSFDYTGFNISYGQTIVGDISPFFFDRIADQRVLSFGLTQHIYGPFRIGFQTSQNVETKQAISTDYFIEYSRRTHSLLLRYNPVLELGSINFKISDFNWSGSTDPFVNDEIRPVVDGVVP